MKPTKMVSVFKNITIGYKSMKAVDGSRMTDVHVTRSCAVTDYGDYIWWLVDLQAIYLITEVALTNRGDQYCESEFVDGRLCLG